MLPKNQFMRECLFLSITAFFLSACTYGHSQINDSSLIGTWKCTSICQVRPSPCNDEIAVYHVSKGKGPNTFHIIMNKVIDGKEEDMGVGEYTFNRSEE